MSLKKATLALAVLVCVISGIPQKSQAIPYYARKYHTTCLRCHTAPPKLNAFGKNFQLFGYQQPGDLLLNKQPVPEDKNLSLLDQAPIAFFIENGVDADRFVNKNQSPFTIGSPLVFHLFASDTIAPDLGFFGEVATEGGVTDIGTVKVIKSFIGGANVHGEIGNFDPTEHGVTEHDLFTRSGYTMQEMDLGGVNIATEHMGVRVFGTIGSSVTRQLMHPKETPQAEPPAPPPPNAETPAPAGSDPRIDAIESQMRKLQQELDDLKKSRQPAPAKTGDVGGHGPLAKTQEPTQTPPPKAAGKKTGDDQGEMADEQDPMNFLKGFLWEVGYYNSVAVSNGNGVATTKDAGDFSARFNAYFNGDSFIGLFAYGGRTTVPDVIGNTQNNNYRVVGADLSFNFGKKMEKTPGMPLKEFNLLASALTGTSNNPNGDGIRAAYKGWFVELQKLFGGRAIGSVKYQRINAGNLLNLPTNAGLLDNTLSLNYTYYLRTNMWFGLEYTHDLHAHESNHALGAVFNFAF